MQKRWGIIGGGMLGMTLAYELAKAGQQVTILENSPQLGGLAAPWKLDSIEWDRHYHVILLSDRHLLQLLQELGLTSDLNWGETKTGFFSDGKLYSLSNTVEFLRFPVLSLIDKLRLGVTILYASRVRDWKSLETQLVKNWLTRLSGHRTTEKIWMPLLRSKLGDSANETAATFMWATIQRMYAARRTGLKKEQFGYVTGGYRRIVERFETRLRELGCDIHTGTQVLGVKQKNTGQVQVQVDSSRSFEFEQVIVTLAAPLVSTVCSELPTTEASRWAEIKYQGLLCASLLLDRPLAGFYVTNITDSGMPFTGIIEMSTLVQPKELGGHHLVYLPKYIAPNSEWFQFPDQLIQGKFLRALEHMYPTFDRSQVRAFQISRVRHVFPIPTLGYSSRLPSFQTSIPGLSIVNSAHIVNGTLNVNETIQLAQRAMRYFRDQSLV